MPQLIPDAQVTEDSAPDVGEQRGEPPMTETETTTIASLPLADARSLLERLRPFTSRNDSRPVLTTIHLDFAPGRIRAAAADGFTLGVVRVPAEVTGAAVVLLPGAAADQLLKALPRKAGAARESVVFVVSTSANGRTDTIRVEHLIFAADAPRIAGTWTFAGVHGTYPRYSELVPVAAPATVTDGEELRRVAVAPAYLARVAKAAGSAVSIRWFLGGPESPATAYVLDGATVFCAVVMPIFVQSEAGAQGYLASRLFADAPEEAADVTVVA